MGKIRDGAGGGHASVEDVTGLILRWQAGHDPDELAALVKLVREPLTRVVSRTLRRCGIHDPAACDEAVGLVMEQIFRLGTDDGRHRPPAFSRSRLGRAAAIDPGWAFLHVAARSRARDVARAARRRARRVADYLAATPRPADAKRDAADVDPERFRAAIAALDARSRQVVMLLLEGKSQAVIAHVLGVCEGTVSRIRAEAIRRLRAILTG